MIRPLLLSAFLALPAQAGDIRAIDGDTFKWGGKSYRVPDIDAPELNSDDCPEERELAELSKVALQSFADHPRVIVQVFDGECGFGRGCATLVVNGNDLREVLIRSGLAAYWKHVNGRAVQKRPQWCE